MNYKSKKLIVFDLDGTLTESKSPLTPDVEALLLKLLEQKPVAIIGGGRWGQFQKQFLDHFNCAPGLLHRLFMFPTTASSFYRYQDGWQLVYAHDLSPETKQRVFDAFKKVLPAIGYTPPETVYGEVIEDRGSQISFSAVGQDIVEALGTEKGVAAKTAWAKLPWRAKITDAMQKELPDLEVKMGGISTIDIVQKGINKGYGLRQIEKYVGVPIRDMLFVGDAIYPGGNDYAVTETGVDYVQIAGPSETKAVIQKILS
jgi:HAD superfamily hydrolase (TIGR01484 family)